MSFRVAVKGKRDWWGAAILSGMALGVAILFYGTIRVECSRPAAGQPARCWGRTTKLYTSYDLASFPLERDAFRVGKTKPNSRGYQYTALVAPTGQLESTALEGPFAQRVVAETNAFYENKEAREWHAADSTWRGTLITLLVGASVLGFFFWLWRGVTIVIDPRGGFISCGNRVWPIADIEKIHQHDSWRFGSEIDLVVAGVPVNVCRGCQKESTTAAVEAMRRATEGGGRTG
jgi:hypothetical protein